MEKRKYKLELTKRYHLDFKQISRIIKYVFEKNTLKSVSNGELNENLGIGKSKLESVRSVCVALGLIKGRNIRLTKIGKVIAEFDLFFDKIETMWILHYIVSSEKKWIIWHKIVNEILQSEEIEKTHPLAPSLSKRGGIVSLKIVTNYFKYLSASYSSNTMTKKLPAEISSVLSAYAESKFSRLNILKRIDNSKYKKLEPKLIDPYSFLYSLLHFRDKFYCGATGLEIKSIIEEENSPGRVFFLKDYQVIQLIDKLHDMGLIVKETFGDLSQIRFNKKMDKNFILNKIYGNEND